jgi:hypothetical protein
LSLETQPLVLPTIEPMVTCSVLLRESTCDIEQSTDVSDCQRLASQEVAIDLAEGVGACWLNCDA